MDYGSGTSRLDVEPDGISAFVPSLTGPVGALGVIARDRVRSAGRRNSIAGTLMGVEGVAFTTTPSANLTSFAHAGGRDGLREVPPEPQKWASRPCLGGGLELQCGIVDDGMAANHRFV